MHTIAHIFAIFVVCICECERVYMHVACVFVCVYMCLSLSEYMYSGVRLVFFLLDELPNKAKEPNLPYYLSLFDVGWAKRWVYDFLKGISSK